MQHQQPSLLNVISGGSSDEALRWDGDFEIWLGATITSYLAKNPPPASSELAADAQVSARNLARHGRDRLRAAGSAPVRLASA
jgi:hypothetical protein